MPSSARLSIRPQNCRRASGSKPVVGSSRNSSSGRPTMPRATSSRRRWPPDRLDDRGRRASPPGRPARSPRPAASDRGSRPRPSRPTRGRSARSDWARSSTRCSTMPMRDRHCGGRLRPGRARARAPRRRPGCGSPRGSRRSWTCRRRSARAARTPRRDRPSRSSPSTAALSLVRLAQPGHPDRHLAHAPMVPGARHRHHIRPTGPPSTGRWTPFPTGRATRAPSAPAVGRSAARSR